MATRHAVPGRISKPAPQENVRVVRTTDSPNCTGACGWLATVVNDVIVDLKPAADYPCEDYNPRGCLRGMSMTHIIYGPDRIRTPLIRQGERGEGKWKEATWDVALDYIAQKMRYIIDQYGPESMLLFNQVVGTSYVQKGAQIRMAALLGMSFATAYDYNGDISMGFTQTLGIDSVECESKSWGYAKYAILWSSNVLQTRIPDAQFLTRFAKQRNNCKIVAIDPRCNQTVKAADLWLPIQPGTDGALALRAYGQQNATAPTPAGLFADASCAGCHGANAMGGLGPPLAETRLSLQEFRRIVREGRGMMPATPASEMPDTEVEQVYGFVRHTKLDLSQVPISYKVGQWLSTARVTLLFSLVALVWLVLTVRVILYWLDCAGWKQLKPYLRRFGYGRAAAVFLRSLVVDGLLVSHLWQRDRFRWVMHALLLYGFLALGLADILMDIFNPTRGTLPITHPLKLLPNIAGLLVLAGAAYVRYRYSEDPYIDNGLTLSRDYTFLTLLTWTIVTGFLLEGLGYAGAYVWVQPVYLLHLALVAALFLTAPFTRFQHAFLVPILMAITRVTSAVAYSGVERGFMYEPSPGRHHKSERIAADVLQKVAPELAAQFRLRYFP